MTDLSRFIRGKRLCFAVIVYILADYRRSGTVAGLVRAGVVAAVLAALRTRSKLLSPPQSSATSPNF